VQRDQAARETEADAETFFGSLFGAGALRKHVENVWKLLGADADARVPHAHHDIRLVTFDRQPDAPAARRELRRIAEKIPEHLCEPRRIGFHLHPLGRQHDRQRLARGLEQRSTRVHRVGDHGRDAHAFLVQIDLVLRDARDVEQVVHESRQLLHLTAKDGLHALPVRLRRLTHAEDLESIADRGERVAQLVGQRRQEFVLPSLRDHRVGQQPLIGAAPLDRERDMPRNRLGEAELVLADDMQCVVVQHELPDDLLLGDQRDEGESANALVEDRVAVGAEVLALFDVLDDDRHGRARIARPGRVAFDREAVRIRQST
jgi:hypothetical protein